MTNVEIYLKSAIENLEAGKLTLSEKVFINSIKDYSKKELKTLSSSDFKLLRSISNK